MILLNENIEIASKYEQFIQFYKYIFKESINNEIYLYKILTTNLLQAMLVKRAEQSHQHQQSSNSALLMR